MKRGWGKEKKERAELQEVLVVGMFFIMG